MTRMKPLLYMLSAACLFSFTEIALKILNGSLNCLEVNFSRYILAGLLLLPLAWLNLRKRQIRLNCTHILWFQLLGFIGITLVGPAYQLAAWLLQANVTSILFSLNPMFIAILAMLILDEPLSHHQWAALLFDIGAVLVLVNPMQMTMDPLGLMLLFFTIFCYSLYAVIGKKMIDELGSAMATAGSFLAGGAQLFFLACCSHIPFVAECLVQMGLADFAEVSLFGGYTIENMGWVLLLIFGVTLGGYIFWFKAMETGSTFIGSLTYFIKPALSPLMALLFLDEAITGRILLGVFLLLAGAAVSLRKDKAQPVLD